MMRRRTLIGASAAFAALSGASIFKGENGAQAAPPKPPAQPKLQLDVSVCFDSGTVLWVPFRPPGAPPGLMHRPLHRLDTGALRSAVVRIPAGWTSGAALTPKARLQLYVLGGQLQLGDLTLRENGYAVLQPERTMSRFGASSGAEVLLVSDGAPAFGAARLGAENQDAVIIPQVALDRETLLWKNEATGATMTMMHTPPNWTSPGPEYHPCTEELYCVSGDIAPDDIRLMKRGWFLWNPAYAIHGFHLHSVTGSAVLEWHDGPWEKILYHG